MANPCDGRIDLIIIFFIIFLLFGTWNTLYSGCIGCPLLAGYIRNFQLGIQIQIKLCTQMEHSQSMTPTNSNQLTSALIKIVTNTQPCQPRILFLFYRSQQSVLLWTCRQEENRAAYFYESNFLSCSLALKNYSQNYKTEPYHLFLRVVNIFTISTNQTCAHKLNSSR